MTYDVKLRKPKCATTVSSVLEATALDLNPGAGTYNIVLPGGPMGPRGPIGLSGLVGPQGSIGLTGAIGEIGPIGKSGANGFSIVKTQFLTIVNTSLNQFMRETATAYLSVSPGKYCITVNCSFAQITPTVTDGILEYWLNVKSGSNVDTRVNAVRQIVHVKVDYVRPTIYQTFIPYLTLVNNTLPYVSNTYFVDILETSQVSFVCQMLADYWVPAGRAGVIVTDLNMGDGSINVYKLSI